MQRVRHIAAHPQCGGEVPCAVWILLTFKRQPLETFWDKLRKDKSQNEILETVSTEKVFGKSLAGCTCACHFTSSYFSVCGAGLQKWCCCRSGQMPSIMPGALNSSSWCVPESQGHVYFSPNNIVCKFILRTFVYATDNRYIIHIDIFLQNNVWLMSCVVAVERGTWELNDRGTDKTFCLWTEWSDYGPFGTRFNDNIKPTKAHKTIRHLMMAQSFAFSFASCTYCYLLGSHPLTYPQRPRMHWSIGPLVHCLISSVVRSGAARPAVPAFSPAVELCIQPSRRGCALWCPDGCRFFMALESSHWSLGIKCFLSHSHSETTLTCAAFSALSIAIKHTDTHATCFTAHRQIATWTQVLPSKI